MIQDGGEELEVRENDDKVAGWIWKFNKSPLGKSRSANPVISFCSRTLC